MAVTNGYRGEVFGEADIKREHASPDGFWGKFKIPDCQIITSPHPHIITSSHPQIIK
jgi:hypothetical protein